MKNFIEILKSKEAVSLYKQLIAIILLMMVIIGNLEVYPFEWAVSRTGNTIIYCSMFWIAIICLITIVYDHYIECNKYELFNVKINNAELINQLQLMRIENSQNKNQIIAHSENIDQLEMELSHVQITNQSLYLKNQNLNKEKKELYTRLEKAADMNNKADDDKIKLNFEVLALKRSIVTHKGNYTRKSDECKRMKEMQQCVVDSLEDNKMIVELDVPSGFEKVC